MLIVVPHVPSGTGGLSLSIARIHKIELGVVIFIPLFNHKILIKVLTDHLPFHIGVIIKGTGNRPILSIKANPPLWIVYNSVCKLIKKGA